MFSIEKRMAFIDSVFSKYKKIKVHFYEGLTIKYCKSIDADFILRGLRNPADFEFEKAIAHTNRKLKPGNLEYREEEHGEIIEIGLVEILNFHGVPFSDKSDASWALIMHHEYS